MYVPELIGVKLLEILVPGTPDVISVQTGVFGIGFVINCVFKSRV